MNITKLASSLWSDACFEWFSCEFSLKFHEPYLLRTITLITFQEQNKSLIIILQHQNWGLNIHSTPLSVGIKLCYSVVRRIIEAQFWHKVHPRPHSRHATTSIRSAPRSRWRNSSLSGSHKYKYKYHRRKLFTKSHGGILTQTFILCYIVKVC